MAVEETGFGVWQDKVLKNLLGSTITYESIKDMKTIGVIHEDGKHLYFNQTGNHGMATGGSGDVLAGVIGGLSGAGEGLFKAAYMGVFLHGSGGDAAAARFGFRGMTSVEIIEGLIEILKN